MIRLAWLRRLSLARWWSASPRTESRKKRRRSRRCLDTGRLDLGRIQLYRGGEAFRLGRGGVRIEVASRETCLAAAARGATLSLEARRRKSNRFLSQKSAAFVAIICRPLRRIARGLLHAEFRKPNKAAEPTRTSGTPPADAGDRASGARGSL